MSVVAPPDRAQVPVWSVACFAVVLLSTTGPLAKHIELQGLALGFHRFVWLALGLLLVMRIRGERLDLFALRWSWLAGVLFAANIAMFFSAVKLTTVANATIIGAIQPALSMVFVGRILGERVRRSDVALTAVAIGGVVIVVYGSSARPEWNLLGDLLSLGAILVWTLYLFVTKRARQHLSAVRLQGALTVVAALAILPVSLASGQSMAVPRSSWIFLAVLALVGGTGHTLVNYAHARTKLLLVSLMFLGVPVLSTSWAAIFLGESLNLWQVTGMAVVIGALGTLVAANVDG